MQQQSRELTEYYIIENVPRATRTDEFNPNVKINGLAFGLPFDLERHFETNFPVPDAYTEDSPDMVLGGSEWTSTEELAEAKELPTDWDRQEVNQAIPRRYVEWLLWHCPAIEMDEKPERVDSEINELEEQPLDPFLYSDTSYGRDECFRSVENQYWFDPSLNKSADTSIDLFNNEVKEQSGLDALLP